MSDQIDLFIHWLNNRLQKIENRMSTIATIGEVLDQTPSQHNKPSPTSHWNLTQLYWSKRKEWPSKHGYHISLIANTNSMEPVIDDNTVVVSEDFSTEEGKEFRDEWPIRVGDICVYEADPKYWGGYSRIIHRIVDVKEENGNLLYKFRGNNNYSNDPGWIPEDKILLRCFEFSNARQPRVGD